MENIGLICSKISVPVEIPNRQWSSSLLRRRNPVAAFRKGISVRRSPFVAEIALEKSGMQNFASISSGKCGTLTVNDTSYSMPFPRSYTLHIGSPLSWIGVGIGLSALFSVLATKLKRYAILQAFRSVMDQMERQDVQHFSYSPSPGAQSPSPVAPPSTSTASPPTLVASQAAFSVDLAAAKDEVASPTEAGDEHN